MPMLKLIAVIGFAFAAGFIIGAAAIHRPIPGAPLELPPARMPWNPKDIMGLIGSSGIRAFAGHLDILPLVVLETDRTFVLKIPKANNKRVHYVLVPKKDIPDTGLISAEDAPYLTDLFLTARKLIEEKGLSEYQIYTNGPGLQSVGYLHFHLVDRKRKTKQ